MSHNLDTLAAAWVEALEDAFAHLPRPAAEGVSPTQERRGGENFQPWAVDRTLPLPLCGAKLGPERTEQFAVAREPPRQRRTVRGFTGEIAPEARAGWGRGREVFGFKKGQFSCIDLVDAGLAKTGPGAVIDSLGVKPKSSFDDVTPGQLGASDART